MGDEKTSSRGGSLAVKKLRNTLRIDHIHGTIVLMEETSEYPNAETNMNFAPIGALFGAKHWHWHWHWVKFVVVMHCFHGEKLICLELPSLVRFQQTTSQTLIGFVQQKVYIKSLRFCVKHWLKSTNNNNNWLVIRFQQQQQQFFRVFSEFQQQQQFWRVLKVSSPTTHCNNKFNNNNK